jgi:spore germination protein KC
MIKKIICMVLSLALLLPLTGCWSYHGLNEITIVAGVGIDLDPSSGDYLLSCEIIDLASTGKETGVKSKIVDSRGATIFEAVRNAKKRLVNKLYWGNAQVLVIGNQLAEQGGVSAAINWFISDAECRETVSIIVSQEKTAKDILTLQGIDNSVVSFEIQKIIDDDQNTTGSIEPVPLYRVYNQLRSPGVCISLPAFHQVINNEKPTVEANGEAVFKGEKLAGYLSAEESKYYLFAKDAINGGILTLSSSEQDNQDVSLEISKNKTKTSYSYKDGRIKETIETNTDVYLDEVKLGTDLLDQREISKLETAAQKKLENDISDVIKKVQTEYDSDIFGYGNMIYKKDPVLWQQLSPKWDHLFQTAQIEVKSKINIVNTSFLKHS